MNNKNKKKKSTSLGIKTTLAIGDSHADPRFPNTRFEALGNFIVKHKPDHIVQMGDFGNLESVTPHLKGKPLLQEGLRLADDIASMKDAYAKLMEPLKKLQQFQRDFHTKIYKPELFWLLGNHEEWLLKYVEELPELQGFVDTHDFVGANKDNWVVVPFPKYIKIDGVLFTHIPMKGGNRLSGKYAASRACDMHEGTIVYGHLHNRHVFSLNRVIAERPDLGRRVDAISAGCFLDYTPDYVRSSGTLDWWRGLMLLSHVAPGEVDIQTFDIRRVLDEYL